MRGLRGVKIGKGGVGWLDGKYIFFDHTLDSLMFWCTPQRLITLNAMKASEEITEEQSRQVCMFFAFLFLFPELSWICSYFSMLIMHMPNFSEV
jgi:hypothetical protein